MTTIGSRLKALLDGKGITPYKLHKRTGVSQSVLSRIINNNTTPNESNLKAIIDYFKVNEAWFLTGIEIEELKNTNGNVFTELPDGSLNITTKLLSFDVYASYKEVLENGTKFEDFEEVTFNVSKYGRGHYMAFKIVGHSMNGGGIDDTPDGALVLGREIGRHLRKESFINHDYGFIILSESGIYHKDISNHNPKTGEITCTSRNKSIEIVQSFSLNLNDVYQIFKVIKRTF
ncbi:helix-turn-helix transcriptional regulator [Aureibaculum sp. 2210JD6-5]|uniref:helix-turn-helix domain-containing protein n=1 Tax=Aureibaculum sp. 2210JD6-5 TaxID=3103957 RepID=UPI002AACB0E4|nr:helix-turn-helix transcriptional regulator [Aureibaculum sp. 2210JD6-5]MDY7396288.1 helix-turn-helix transcriptional regulator [Aureibaculum sp. 2210JD6-5]